MNDLTASRQQWTGIREPVIPVHVNSKKPLRNDWPDVPPAQQWEGLGEQWNGNIARLLGDGRSAIDTDDAATTDAVRVMLAGLGYSPVVMQTPSDGRHFYINITDAPPNINTGNLTIGKGELRCRRAIVLVPSSSIEGRPYQFEPGSELGQIPRLSPLRWRDIQHLVREPQATPTDTLPVRLLHREMSISAKKLFSALKGAAKKQAITLTDWHGETTREYPTRSHAECAIIAMLILHGWALAEIMAAFQRNMPGHYQDKEKYAGRYLSEAYHLALTDIVSTEPRRQIAETYRQTEAMIWTGNLLDRKAILGLLALCYQWGTWQVRANERDVAEHAGASRVGIHNVLKRLADAKLIIRLDNAHGRTGTLWDCTPLSIYDHKLIAVSAMAPYPPSPPTVTYGHGLTPPHDSHPELWAQLRLGRVGEVVYAVLGDSPQSINALSKAVNRARATVKAALLKLARYGLTEPQIGGGWTRGTVSLADAAKETGAEEAGQRRREKHQAERDSRRATQRAYMERMASAGQDADVRGTSAGEVQHGGD